MGEQGHQEQGRLAPVAETPQPPSAPEPPAQPPEVPPPDPNEPVEPPQAPATAGRRWISRRRAAHRVSSLWFESCSLRSTAETCVSTVFTDRCRRLARFGISTRERRARRAGLVWRAHAEEGVDRLAGAFPGASPPPPGVTDAGGR
jgi:hypothetical protein